MDSKTKFSLELSIDRWKSQLLETGCIKEEDAMELLSHLQDSITSLKSKGLDDDEAFYIAQKRLGTIKQLEEEYEKVKPIAARFSDLNLLAQGMLLYLFLAGFNQFIYDTILMVSDVLGVKGAMLQNIAIAIVSLLGVGYVLSFFLQFQNGRILNHRLLRIPNLILGILLFRGLSVIAQPWALSEMSHHIFGEIRVSLYIFNAIFLFSLLAFMYVIHAKTKKSFSKNLRKT